MNSPPISEGILIALVISSPIFIVVAIYWANYMNIPGQIYNYVKGIH